MSSGWGIIFDRLSYFEPVCKAASKYENTQGEVIKVSVTNQQSLLMAAGVCVCVCVCVCVHTCGCRCVNKEVEIIVFLWILR